MPAAAPEPTPRRMVLCGVAVIAFATGLWGWIHWRSAPPPVPKVQMPALPP